MKPRLLKWFVGVLTVASVAVSLAVSLSAQTAPDASPVAKAKDASGKKPKAPRKDTGDSSLPPKTRKAKEIPYPVPMGFPSHDIKIPSYDNLGKVLSTVAAAKATRIDNEHVQMEGMVFDLNQTGDKDSYHVEMPTCVLNLKTNVVTSEQPVVIRTKDFELTGEKVQFDTVERSGELRGRVHMRIFNLKQVATPGAPPAS